MLEVFGNAKFMLIQNRKTMRQFCTFSLAGFCAALGVAIVLDADGGSNLPRRPALLSIVSDFLAEVLNTNNAAGDYIVAIFIISLAGSLIAPLMLKGANRVWELNFLQNWRLVKSKTHSCDQIAALLIFFISCLTIAHAVIHDQMEDGLIAAGIGYLAGCHYALRAAFGQSGRDSSRRSSRKSSMKSVAEEEEEQQEEEAPVMKSMKMAMKAMKSMAAAPAPAQSMKAMKSMAAAPAPAPMGMKMKPMKRL